MTHPSVASLESQPHKRSANGMVSPFAPILPAEVVGKILSLTGESSTFIARVAVLGRAWHDAVEYLDHLDVRLHETSKADRSVRTQEGTTSLILRARRLQILDIEFTHSQYPEEDRALSNQSLTPVAVLEPGVLAKWIDHTKPSLLQLAVAVTTSRNPIVNEAALVETILIHTRGATKLNKLWLHNLDLDLPTIQGSPQGTFPVMAASLKPRRVSQLFVEHFLAQSPRLLFLNVDLATDEQELTFTSTMLQRLALTILPGTMVSSITLNIPSLLRLKLEAPYPFGTLNAPLCSKLSHVNVRVFSSGPEVEDIFRMNLATELPDLQGATFHLPNLSWQRVKAMIGQASGVQHVAFTRSMDSVLLRTELEIEEVIQTFPRLVSAYFGEAIFCDLMGSGGPENWRGESKWKEMQAMRVVTTTTSREFVIAIAKLVRKCPNLMVLEIARPYGCEEDRVAAAVGGDAGYESSDSQGQPLVDYRELERENLEAIVARLHTKYPQLYVKAAFGVGEYDYYGWQFSVICRPNRDAL